MICANVINPIAKFGIKRFTTNDFTLNPYGVDQFIIDWKIESKLIF